MMILLLWMTTLAIKKTTMLTMMILSGARDNEDGQDVDDDWDPGGDGLFIDAHGKDYGKDGCHDEAEHDVCWTMMSTMTTKLTATIMTRIMTTMLIALRTLLTMTMPMV